MTPKYAIAAGVGALALAVGGTTAVVVNQMNDSQAAASLYISPTGNDANPCTQASPCLKLDTAYHRAKPGDTVQLLAGVYATQGDSAGITRIKIDPTKAGNTDDVTFEPVPGQSVEVQGGIEMGYYYNLNAPHDITFRGFKVDGSIVARVQVNDITIDQMDIGRFYCQSCDGMTVTDTVADGRRVPNTVNTINSTAPITGCDAACMGSENIKIDHFYAHDYVVTDPANHSECGQFWPNIGLNISVTNSVFQNCTDFGILLKPGARMQIIFENDFFDVPMPGEVATASCTPNCPRGGSSLRVAQGNNNCLPSSCTDYSGTVIRNNTMLGALVIDTTPGSASIVKANNLVGLSTGPPASLVAQLVDANTKDGTMDLHLVPGAAAIDAVVGSNFPAIDIDGQARPIGSAADIGADEFGESGPPGTTTTTTTTEPTTTTTSTTTTESTTTTTTESTTTTETTTTPPQDSLPLTVVATTATTVTVGWTPQGDQGYRFLVDGVSVSNTNDPARSSAKFSRKAGAIIKVIARSEVASGTVVSP